MVNISSSHSNVILASSLHFQRGGFDVRDAAEIRSQNFVLHFTSLPHAYRIEELKLLIAFANMMLVFAVVF